MLAFLSSNQSAYYTQSFFVINSYHLPTYYFVIRSVNSFNYALSTMDKLTVLNGSIDLRTPSADLGAAVAQLIRECPPLDSNSTYCNLLQCSHFAETSVAALRQRELVGFISGYRLPQQPDTLFIWQVAVSEKARGQRLATRMLQHILTRPNSQDIIHLETTITPDNQASWALFKGLAKRLDTPIMSSVLFDKERHFAGAHDSELLVRIGPFQPQQSPGHYRFRTTTPTPIGRTFHENL